MVIKEYSSVSHLWESTVVRVDSISLKNVTIFCCGVQKGRNKVEIPFSGELKYRFLVSNQKGRSSLVNGQFVHVSWISFLGLFHKMTVNLGRYISYYCSVVIRVH
jgi:hypothetical protein